MEGLYSYSPINRTGSPQGFSQVQFSHRLNKIQCTKHAHYTNVKQIKHNPKVSPFGIALVKNGK